MKGKTGFLRRLLKNAVFFMFAGGIFLFSSGATAGAGNLVPDPGFERADFATRPHYQNVAEKGLPWIFHPIEEPARTNVEKDGETVVISGGYVYLHSAQFEVEPGAEYDVGLEILEGNARVRLDILWRRPAGRDIVVDAGEVNVAAGSGPRALEGRVTAPEEVENGYLRIAVKNGTVKAASPSVVRR